MSYQDLVNKNLIISYVASREQILKELRLAERDIRVAKKTLEQDYDWAFAIAYNAVLQAARALIFSKGYRPRGTDQHKTVLEFMRMALGREYEEKVGFLDKMRVKRHKIMYDEPDLVSKSEAKFAIKIAEEFVGVVRKRLGNSG